jgi:hypothetical protein
MMQNKTGNQTKIFQRCNFLFDDAPASQPTPNKKRDRIKKPMLIIQKDCEEDVFAPKSVDIFTLPDGGLAGILPTGIGVGVAQPPGVTPSVGANRAARAS